jgi:ABC-type amino acid transport substrate-binding protein
MNALRCLVALVLAFTLTFVFPVHASSKAKKASPITEVSIPEPPPPSPRKVLVAIPNNVFAKLVNGEPRGILLEGIDRIARQLDWQPNYIVMAASDIPKALSDGEIDVSAVRILPSRGPGSDHFSEPLINEYNILIVRAGERFPVSQAKDLSGKVMAGREGFHYPMLEKVPFLRLQRYDTDGAMIRALLMGKVDIAVIAALSDVFAFRTEGVMRRLDVLDRAIGVVPLRAALSGKRFADSDMVRFNQAWSSLLSSTGWQEITNSNGFTDLIRDWPLLAE